MHRISRIAGVFWSKNRGNDVVAGCQKVGVMIDGA